jgi:hypothetical protein
MTTTNRQNIARLLLYLTGAVFLLGAVADLVMTTVPDHELAFISQTMASIDPKIAALILIFTRMIGCWYIGLAIGIIGLTGEATRPGGRRARLIIAGMTLLPNILVTLLTNQLGVGPNLFAAVAIIALSGAGLGLATFGGSVTP